MSWGGMPRVTGGLVTRPWVLLIGLLAAWLTLHLAFAQYFIFHDSWKHGFPLIFAIAKQSHCGALTSWFGLIDNGSPTLIYLISLGLTQVLLVPFVYLLGCVHPDVTTAMYAYKAQIYLAYLAFGFGMFVLGRVLFRHALSSAYLLAITLFAGMCLDNAHSSQIVNIVFWSPWILSFLVLALREPGGERYFLYLNAAGLLVCAQLLDQYPHFIALVGLVSGLLFYLLGPRSSLNPVIASPRRLIPVAIALVVTTIQLFIIRGAILDYAPSLRTELAVTPSEFGEMGFLQPSAFIGILFPISFLGGFEVFADGTAAIVAKLVHPGPRWFIFRLDALLLGVGIVPVLFALAFLFSNADRRLRIGLGSFVGIICVIALQPTRIYYLLFQLPFFDVFRSYFLFTIFAVFGLLLTSAFGVDRLITCDASERRSAVKRALRVLIGFAALAAVALIIMFVAGPKTVAEARRIQLLVFVDVVFLALSFTAFRAFGIAPDPARALIGILVLTVGIQCVVSAAAYFQVGLRSAQMIERFGLDPEDLRDPPSLGPEARLEEFRRKQCFRFSQCYLSSQPTVSLNTDLNGTFLRHRDEPVFLRKDVGESIVKGLTGLSRPVAWLSETTAPVPDRSTAVSVLRMNSANLDEYLKARVVVYGRWRRPELPAPPSERHLELRRWEAEQMSFVYSSDVPLRLVVATNYDRHWRAMVGGKAVPLERANLGNLSISVPSGRGQLVQLQYRNLSSEVVIYSRLGLVGLAALVALWLAVLTLSRRRR